MTLSGTDADITLAQFIQLAGEPVEIGGNRPFLLSEPGWLWWVERGAVEIFSVLTESGEPVGRRNHFCSIGAGEAFFGMDADRYGGAWGFLAVGRDGTRLLRLPLERALEAALDPERGPDLTAVVDRWVISLSLGASRDINPRTDVAAVAGEELTLEVGQSLHARRDVLWVELRRGRCLFLDMEEISAELGSSCFPVSQDSWIVAMEACELSVRSTAAVLGHAAFREWLEQFHERVFLCEETNRRLAVADDLMRLKEKLDGVAKARGEADAHLASILKSSEENLEAKAAGDHLLAACMLVGRALGVEVRPLRGAGQNAAPSKDPLGDILRASRIRARRVRLREGWMHSDTGPLLAFRREGMRPVAIFAGPSGKTLMRDPAAAETRLVDEALARELEPYGYTFYKPFPQRELNGADLLRMALIPSARDLRTVILVGLLGGLITSFIPLAVRYTMVRIVPLGQLGPLHRITAVLLLSAAAAALFEIGRNIALMRVEGKADAVLQPALMDRLLRLPVSFFKDYSAGDLAERCLSIVAIRQRFSGASLISLLGVIFGLFHFAILFYFDARLALGASLLIFLTVLINLWGTLRQIGHMRLAVGIEGKLSGMVFQFINGISKLRAAGAEAHAFAAWAKPFTRQHELTVKSRRVANLLSTWNGSLAGAILLSIFLLVSIPSFSRLSAGDFIAFNTALMAFVAAMLAASTSLMSVLNAIPFLDRIRPILETPPEVVGIKADPGTLRGGIEATDLTFRYRADGPLVLNGVSFSVRPGELVAFVGASGSGKSTLVRLLLGFEHPETGAISYDGRDLGALDVQAVRRQIGVVLQGSEVVPGDIYSNISGSLPLSSEEVWEAARMAGLAREIEALPMGMSTRVTAGGKTFSGGQKQRLLIARALATRPRILFFDEATSALDNRSQAAVSENLERLQATRIVIAHRLSTIMNADRIYVLDGGSIVQAGSYGELMRQEGLFAQMARRQLIGERREERGLIVRSGSIHG